MWSQNKRRKPKSRKRYHRGVSATSSTELQSSTSMDDESTINSEETISTENVEDDIHISDPESKELIASKETVEDVSNTEPERKELIVSKKPVEEASSTDEPRREEIFSKETVEVTRNTGEPEREEPIPSKETIEFTTDSDEPESKKLILSKETVKDTVNTDEPESEEKNGLKQTVEDSTNTGELESQELFAPKKTAEGTTNTEPQNKELISAKKTVEDVSNTEPERKEPIVSKKTVEEASSTDEPRREEFFSKETVEVTRNTGEPESKEPIPSKETIEEATSTNAPGSKEISSKETVEDATNTFEPELSKIKDFSSCSADVKTVESTQNDFYSNEPKENNEQFSNEGLKTETVSETPVKFNEAFIDNSGNKEHETTNCSVSLIDLSCDGDPFNTSAAPQIDNSLEKELKCNDYKSPNGKVSLPEKVGNETINFEENANIELSEDEKRRQQSFMAKEKLKLELIKSISPKKVDKKSKCRCRKKTNSDSKDEEFDTSKMEKFSPMKPTLLIQKTGDNDEKEIKHTVKKMVASFEFGLSKNHGETELTVDNGMNHKNGESKSEPKRIMVERPECEKVIPNKRFKTGYLTETSGPDVHTSSADMDHADANTTADSEDIQPRFVPKSDDCEVPDLVPDFESEFELSFETNLEIERVFNFLAWERVSVDISPKLLAASVSEVDSVFVAFGNEVSSSTKSLFENRNVKSQDSVKPVECPSKKKIEAPTIKNWSYTVTSSESSEENLNINQELKTKIRAPTMDDKSGTVTSSESSDDTSSESSDDTLHTSPELDPGNSELDLSSPSSLFSERVVVAFESSVPSRRIVRFASTSSDFSSIESLPEDGIRNSNAKEMSLCSENNDKKSTSSLKMFFNSIVSRFSNNRHIMIGACMFKDLISALLGFFVYSILTFFLLIVSWVRKWF